MRSYETTQRTFLVTCVHCRWIMDCRERLASEMTHYVSSTRVHNLFMSLISEMDRKGLLWGDAVIALRSCCRFCGCYGHCSSVAGRCVATSHQPLQHIHLTSAADSPQNVFSMSDIYITTLQIATLWYRYLTLKTHSVHGESAADVRCVCPVSNKTVNKPIKIR